MRSRSDKFKFCIYWLLAFWLPRNSFCFLFKKWRALFARWIIGKKRCGLNINVDHGAEFSSFCKLGDNSDIGINCLLEGPVEIGRDVMMAPNCKFYTRNHNYNDLTKPMNKQGLSQPRKITVSDDVWFGTNCIILPGVNIGKGVIVGAGSIVTKDIPDYAVVAGNPAKVIKYRLSNDK